MTNKEKTMFDWIDEANQGSSEALQVVLSSVQDSTFNLALRMLGNVADAEDATQDILIRIMTNLANFRKESSLSTWAYRIAVNTLIDYKKSMFAQHPLSFDFYANDIQAGFIDNTDELLSQMSEEVLAKELKLSCSNVMLQCLDPQTRCIFILGTMFKINSRMAAEILDMTPENYRQKLSRARRKMADFLSVHCGLSETGYCRCQKRVGYAIKEHRLNPNQLEYLRLEELDPALLKECSESMEQIDEMSTIFEELPLYRSPLAAKEFLQNLLKSDLLCNIQRLNKERCS